MWEKGKVEEYNDDNIKDFNNKIYLNFNFYFF
jgi:hypothetical protein